MALWGSINYANNAPKWATRTGTGGNPLYAVGIANNHGNTVFAVPNAQKTNTKAAHAGWVFVKKGTGFVSSLTITAGGTTYSNTNYWRANTGTIEANGTLTTNSTGGIISYTVTNYGAGFVTTPTIAVVNSTGGTTGVGTGATLTPVMGGRFGRIQAETLVAMGSATANGGGSEFTNLI